LIPTKLIAEDKISIPEWSPSAKIALELAKSPTVIFPPAKNKLANIEIWAIFSFILPLNLFSQ
jgi:hypothetical protein